MTARKDHNQEKRYFHKSNRGVLFRTFRPLILAIDHLLQKRFSQRKIAKSKRRQLNEFAIN
jgi:hypothetical protein